MSPTPARPIVSAMAIAPASVCAPMSAMANIDAPEISTPTVKRMRASTRSLRPPACGKQSATAMPAGRSVSPAPADE